MVRPRFWLSLQLPQRLPLRGNATVVAPERQRMTLGALRVLPAAPFFMGGSDQRPVAMNKRNACHHCIGRDMGPDRIGQPPAP